MEHVSCYPTHRTDVESLSDDNKAKIENLCQTISKSLANGSQAFAAEVNIEGHADSDPRGEAFLQQVSVERANSVYDFMQNRVQHLISQYGLDTQSFNKISWTAIGLGDSQKIITNPTSELERCQNRRAVIQVVFVDVPSSPTTPTPQGSQDNWKWCSKCQVLAYAGFGNGTCPAGGQHDHGGSFNYVLHHDTQLPNGQDNWKWCSKCQSLVYAGSPSPGACPAGGQHDHGGSLQLRIAS